MAARKKQTEITEREGVLGIIISRDQYREYVELQEERDRSEASMRARMFTQNQEMIDFACDVIKLIERAGLDNLSALTGKSAIEVYDRAKIIKEG